MSGTGVYDILNPIMDDLAIGLAQSPTAHREAETAKAHRG